MANNGSNINFLSVKNLLNNIQILKTYFQKEHNIDITELNLNLQQLFFENMKQIFEHRDNQSKSLKELNYIAISTIRDRLLDNNTFKNIKQSNNAAQIGSNHMQKMGRVNEPALTIKEDKEKINQLYQQRTQDYKQQTGNVIRNITPLTPMVDINMQPMEPKNEEKLLSINTNEDNSDIAGRYKEMQDSIKKEFSYNQNINESQIIEQIKSENFKPSFFQNSNEIVEQYQQAPAQQKNQQSNIMEQFNPSQAYPLNKLNDKLPPPQEPQAQIQPQIQEVAQVTKNMSNEQNNMLIYNSDYTKDAGNNKNEIIGTNSQQLSSASHFNYIEQDGRLLNKILDGFQKIISQNANGTTSIGYGGAGLDPNVQMALNTIQNDNSGANKDSYQLYTKNIIINGYDRNTAVYPYRNNFTVAINSTLDESMSIDTSIKNIFSIKVTQVIVPMGFITNKAYNYVSDATLNYFITNYYHQYLGLHIKDLIGEYDGTNSHIKTNISNLIVDKTYYNQDGRNFVVFKPMQEDKKTFKTPLARLSSMNISLNTPHGILINKYQDNTIEVSRLALVNSGTQLQVFTATPFTHNDIFK